MYREILPRMCQTDPDLTLQVVARNPLRRSLPRHASIRRAAPFSIDSWLRPYRLWQRPAHYARRVAYSAAVRGDRGRLWHSTYFTVPLRWDGPILVTVYDMIHERFPELFPGGGIAQVHRKKSQAVHAADRVISISESTRVDVIERYELDPILFI